MHRYNVFNIEMHKRSLNDHPNFQCYSVRFRGDFFSFIVLYLTAILVYSIQYSSINPLRMLKNDTG
ncbi:hypothetical protein D1BOALGB6SA_2004 [Olavius sp. associated proteobacterium Delta 1]|nr:hypothetical protein D1BOALGB6SA_2004 [Olavius sp. associated proteobacterium Delta 1]